MPLIKTNILSRYLVREALSSVAVVTFLLLLIFLSHHLVRLLSYAASGKVAANILLQLIGFEIPYLLAFLLPLGFYLGVIWAYGGMYANNELRVMHACGMSLQRLLKQLGVLAVIVMAIVLVLMLWVNPLIAKAKDQIISRSKATDNIVDAVLPGRFQASRDGSRVMYVEQISRDHKEANNIFIADQKKDPTNISNSRWTVVSAVRGYQTRDHVTQNRFLVAEQGNRYEGTPGQNDYKVIQFKKYMVHEPDSQMKTQHQAQEGIPTNQLWNSYDKPGNAAELQWRLSIPLSVLLLAVLAIPLSQVKPRQGRYVQLLIAVLIYILYVNLLFVSRNWIEQKMLPIGLGMWWVHLLLLILIAWMFMSLLGKSFSSIFRRSA